MKHKTSSSERPFIKCDIKECVISQEGGRLPEGLSWGRPEAWAIVKVVIRPHPWHSIRSSLYWPHRLSLQWTHHWMFTLNIHYHFGEEAAAGTGEVKQYWLLQRTVFALEAKFLRKAFLCWICWMRGRGPEGSFPKVLSLSVHTVGFALVSKGVASLHLWVGEQFLTFVCTYVPNFSIDYCTSICWSSWDGCKTVPSLGTPVLLGNANYLIDKDTMIRRGTISRNSQPDPNPSGIQSFVYKKHNV